MGRGVTVDVPTVILGEAAEIVWNAPMPLENGLPVGVSVTVTLGFIGAGVSVLITIAICVEGGAGAREEAALNEGGLLIRYPEIAT